MSIKRVGEFVCKENPFRVIREAKDYHWHYLDIKSGLELRATLRAGPYAWPGGYPLHLICDDGDSLCFDCAKDNIYQAIYSIRNNINDGWKIIGCEVNWEDTDMVCAHCNHSIESAYGEFENE